MGFETPQMQTPEEMRHRWDRIVGVQLATISTPRVMTDDDGGTLHVSVRMREWLDEFRLMEPQIRGLMPAEVCGIPLKRIRFRFEPESQQERRG